MRTWLRIGTLTVVAAGVAALGVSAVSHGTDSPGAHATSPPLRAGSAQQLVRYTIVFYTEHADVDAGFAPTGRAFAITQSHWFRMKDGKIIEHWANRDDLGMARQAGWVPPPTPAYLIRCARLKHRAHKALPT